MKINSSLLLCILCYTDIKTLFKVHSINKLFYHLSNSNVVWKQQLNTIFQDNSLEYKNCNLIEAKTKLKEIYKIFNPKRWKLLNNNRGNELSINLNMVCRSLNKSTIFVGNNITYVEPTNNNFRIVILNKVKMYYIEFLILNKSRDSNIGIGLADEKFPLKGNFIGFNSYWDDSISWGIQSSGYILSGTNNKIQSDHCKYDVGDKIGLCFNRYRNTLTFFKNGNFLYKKTLIELDNKQNYWPTVTLYKLGDKVEICKKYSVSIAKIIHYSY